VLDNGDLRLLVLDLLSERPRHGYEIIKALEERVGGGYSPSPGVVYPTLSMLEDLGQAAVAEARAGRKLYALTPEGEAALDVQRPVVEGILARLAAGAGRGAPPPRVQRAMENLAAAVRLRLQAGPLGEAEARAIADLLDTAARGVEEVA
jgi:DNA-binding PadR family transcriptional regulator